MSEEELSRLKSLLIVALALALNFDFFFFLICFTDFFSFALSRTVFSLFFLFRGLRKGKGSKLGRERGGSDLCLLDFIVYTAPANGV